MKTHKLPVIFCFACAAVVAVASAIIAADQPGHAAGDALDLQLPPGWTEADMKSCMEAATPGAPHKRLADDLGEWAGECTMWMGPGAEPVTNPCSSTVTSVMDGRFTQVEMNCEIPGMGPFKGLGFYGFDNVSQQFVSSWLDSMTTGIMTGVGEASDDGKTITWTFTGNCPITKKPTTIREIETNVDANTKTLEMWGVDPKSGKEFKSMALKLTRK